MRLATVTLFSPCFLRSALRAIPAVAGPPAQPPCTTPIPLLSMFSVLLVSFESLGRTHSLNVIRVAHGVPAVNAHEICRGENIPKRNTRGRMGWMFEYLDGHQDSA